MSAPVDADAVWADVHILYTPLEEVRRDALDVRWCFTCRDRRQFMFVVKRPTEPLSYYGPIGEVMCSRCGTINGDLGFGREREAVGW